MSNRDRPDAGPAGKAFEGRVAEAYRSLGYQVTPNIQLPGKQTDLTARREVEGAPPIVLAIECKDHESNVSNTDVIDFVSRVITHRASNEISSGVMVSASGFTADGRAAAAAHPYVTLLSWEELTNQMLDVRNQLREIVDGYEASPIYHQYLSLFVEPLSWSTLAPEDDDGTSVETMLELWRGKGQPGTDANSLFILADFGAGKTTLLNYVHYDRAKAYLAGEDARIPLLVPLRNFRESQDVDALLRASFRDTYYRDLPSDLLWRRLESGHFYVLLDGFDEMVERSDATRRLDLFYALMGILQSKSPTVMTSRPSYFVERDELDSLLSTLREQEAGIAARSSPPTSVSADRLRRALVNRHRERPAPGRATEGLNPRSVRVMRLLPLDRDRIKSFVERRAAELETVGTSPDAVMAFIDRTYDLTDLASRPLLLEMIISSVLLGQLDVNDTNAQYGASGLYEIYTHAKLDLDLAKGLNRQGGLPLETRRLLAEALAVEMYKQNVLEVDFHEMLDRLLSQDGPVRRALAGSNLSAGEIATDFATCSFVTLDDDSTCRFVHKSFRGFFLARVLKENLRPPHPMLLEPLEREALYFLGGFAPTQPRVGEQLWAGFLHADTGAVSFRRNLLVAHLYTRPDHDTRRIADAEIADAGFGRLAFTGSRMTNTEWSDCTVMKLDLDGVAWRDVQIVDSHFEDMEVVDSDVGMTTLQSQIGQLRARRSRVVHRSDGRNAGLEDVAAEDSYLHTTNAMTLDAVRSVVTCDGERPDSLQWRLEDSVLAFGRSLRSAGLGGFIYESPSTDSRSVVLAPRGISPSLLSSISCGVFGSMEHGVDRELLSREPRAWGVLEADDLLTQLSLPADETGFRYGSILLVRSSWYQREKALDGRLSTVLELQQLANGAPRDGVRPPSAASGSQLTDLLAQTKQQLSALGPEGWPELPQPR